MNFISSLTAGSTVELELSLVLPVYNDVQGIESTLRAWLKALGKIEAEIIVVDDGSTDGTGGGLDRLAADRSSGNLRVIHQENAGHGPAVRKGYESARGEWVFQADSDNEVSPDFFQRLWEKRGTADLILGRRLDREESRLRRLITFIIPLITWPWSRRIVPDLNVPFRLIRREMLNKLLKYIPENAFAPNLLISLLTARSGLKIRSIPVPHHGDGEGGKTLAGRKLWKALRSAWADLRFLPLIRGPGI